MSGAEAIDRWLSAVPADWAVLRLRHLLSKNDSGVWGEDGGPEDTVVLRSTEQSVDGRWRIEAPAHRTLSAREEVQSKLSPGDLVVTKSSGSARHIGKTSLVDQEVAALDACFSNFMQRLRVRPPNDPRFFWYFLNQPAGREQLFYRSSTTTGLANLNGTILGSITVPVPDPADQRAIASFLDRETARIDILIAKKRRLLDLLEEKRTALITRAVTRGLDPDVPMKDSGVEWFGEIPEHWQVSMLRRIARVVDCKHRTPTYIPQGYPLVSTTEVKPGLLDLSVCRRFVGPEDFADMTEGPRLPTRGDIIYSRNASLGAAALVEMDEPFCMGQDVVLIRTGENPGFLRRQLNSPVVRSQVEALGIGSTFSRINVATIRGLKVAVPPRQEQQRIAAYLEEVTARGLRTSTKIDQAISLLKDYRTALISEATTGRLAIPADATNAQLSIP